MADTAPTGNDMKAHARGYGLFTGIMKWGTIFSFAVAAIVVVLIAS